jgi:hypothetical protein
MTMYRQRPDIVTREIIGETLLVPIRGEVANMQKIFSLTEVGAFIWNALDGEQTEDMIVDALCEHFDTDAEVARTDCADFVAQLREAQLVEEA